MFDLSDLILEKGIDHLKIKNVDENLKKALVEAGYKLLKAGKTKEAVKALLLSQDKKKMEEMGLELLEKKDLINAAELLKGLGNKEILNEVGFFCVKEGLFQTALEVFEKADNQQMAKFIQANFLNSL